MWCGKFGYCAAKHRVHKDAFLDWTCYTSQARWPETRYFMIEVRGTVPMGEAVWAPWRMDYILSDKVGGCIFCDKPRLQRDVEHHILWRGDTAFVMMNRYPYNNGHLMVAPHAHVASLAALETAQRSELFELTARCEQVLQQAVKPEGFNIGLNLGAAAGAGIAEHLHMHIVPRWAGDTNFMTVLGEVRVIPQHLDETYQLLVSYFNTLQNGTASPS
jgi:ATP adenylyltransferase